ncbi:MAG: carbohydrate kinase [Saprospiraceae bacterium]|nr:carbohydrate kinase [Saprospiraceae bacterium]
MLLLGFDLGSSSVKAALVDATSGRTLGLVQYPELEMPIAAPQPEWAEQHPHEWWSAACMAARKLLATTGADPAQVGGIGIGYQMHGLVCLAADGTVLRPSIIWCDSRAVSIGEKAFQSLGVDHCLHHYLNSPGNFTASKLRWVLENEPEVFEKIDKIMLPGDYLAYRLTGEMNTTITGLSEGMLWDFHTHSPSRLLLEYYEIPERMIPPIVPVFGVQGRLHADAARELGLPVGIPVGYRAGDQPNNALSLNVLRPGEIAATGGTSGVVYAVTDQPKFDPEMRVNSFAHVNYTKENPLTGVLLCINGAGSAYRWVRQAFGHESLPYSQLETLAATVPIGSDSLIAMPFGNGAERMLGNRNPGAAFSGVQFNRHEPRHFYRAVLEGIAFSFVYGIEVMREMGIAINMLKVGNDNLFQSNIFAGAVSTLVGAPIEVYATSGAVGAAKAAGVAAGAYPNAEVALQGGDKVTQIEPEKNSEAHLKAFEKWKARI